MPGSRRAGCGELRVTSKSEQGASRASSGTRRFDRLILPLTVAVPLIAAGCADYAPPSGGGSPQSAACYPLADGRAICQIQIPPDYRGQDEATLQQEWYRRYAREINRQWDEAMQRQSAPPPPAEQPPEPEPPSPRRHEQRPVAPPVEAAPQPDNPDTGSATEEPPPAPRRHEPPPRREPQPAPPHDVEAGESRPRSAPPSSPAEPCNSWWDPCHLWQ